MKLKVEDILKPGAKLRISKVSKKEICKAIEKVNKNKLPKSYRHPYGY